MKNNKRELSKIFFVLAAICTVIAVVGNIITGGSIDHIPSYTVVAIAAFAIIFLVTGILLKLKEKLGMEILYKVFLGIGIAILVVGVIAGTIMIMDGEEEEGIITTFMTCIVGWCLIFGYITHRILPDKKYSFWLGFGLGIVGIIIAICTKPKESNVRTVNNSNKYEDLVKIQQLRDSGILSQAEFEEEKAKLLR